MWEKYAISHTLYDLSIIENVIIIMRLCYSYQAADDAMAADANVPAGRRQGDVDAVPRASPRRRPSDFVDDYDDAPHTASRLASGRGLESPTGSGPPPIVALNETGRGPSRIGATLYQAPSPHSGFTATQNVVSSSAARPVDVDQVSAAVRGGGRNTRWCRAPLTPNNLSKALDPHFNIYIAPGRPKTQSCSEDRELNQARSKPSTVDQLVRTARTSRPNKLLL